MDENGNTVVSYGYDAWGAPLWCTGELAETLGKVQPFRYRGYVFDEENFNKYASVASQMIARETIYETM